MVEDGIFISLKLCRFYLIIIRIVLDKRWVSLVREHVITIINASIMITICYVVIILIKFWLIEIKRFIFITLRKSRTRIPKRIKHCSLIILFKIRFFTLFQFYICNCLPSLIWFVVVITLFVFLHGKLNIFLNLCI